MEDDVTTKKPPTSEVAYFAGGCFWGVEHHFEKVPGVLSAESGYMGGSQEDPTYQQVCTGGTGHVETVKVTFDPGRVSYETLARLFFEIHDPTQSDGQGPDLGEQYLSVIFHGSQAQRDSALGLVELLRKRGYKVSTRILPATTFWRAEEYHQDYYARTGKSPYCHVRVRRFDE